VRRTLKPEIKLGADKKRTAVLGGLLAILVLVWWLNREDTPSVTATTTTPPRPAASVPAPGIRTPVPATRPRTPEGDPGSPVRAAQFGRGRGQAVQEFKPSLKPDENMDPSQVDPTLKLALLERLRSVTTEGASRSVFDFGQAPAPKIEVAKVKPINPMEKGVMTGPVQPPKPAPPPPPPPPPPIPLKFYGFTAQRQGPKRAFFLEGEEIYVAAEGETIKNRYKIIRIGVNSAVVEDTTNKHQQTLPLAEEAQQS
jgi:hypothetical protein